MRRQRRKPPRKEMETNDKNLLLRKYLGAQASLPACFSQSAIAGSLQAGMPALPGALLRKTKPADFDAESDSDLSFLRRFFIVRWRERRPAACSCAGAISQSAG